MKILLVHPRANKRVILKDKFSMHEPLALEYLAAGLLPHHDVRILDLRADDNYEETLQKFQPQVVAATGYTIHVNYCRELLRKAKAFDRNILTVIGGHHATVMPEDFIESDIDVIVIGEGVFTFREIVEAREKGKPLEEIEGLALNRGGNIFRTPCRAYTDLDQLPFPARSLTQQYRNRYSISTMNPLASIRTSLGCYFRCNYCALWQITQGKYLTRDPRLVVEELSGIAEPNVFFADDESMLKADRMLNLADLIKEAGIKKNYRLFARADTVVRSPELIERWCRVGLRSVVVGFEAFTDEDLKMLNKATTTSMNEEAISILKRMGVEICADFIVTQDYTHEKFKRLSDYVRKLGLKTVIFPILTPLPGTKLFEETKHKIMTKDYDLYDFKHTVLPTDLPLDEFYSEFANLHLLMFSGYRRLLYERLFPLTQYLPTFGGGYEILMSLRNLYRDHNN